MSLIEATSARLRRSLSRERFLQLRSTYLGLKKRSASLLKVLHGSFSTDDLIAEIDRRIDSDWTILMVHSSVNGLEPMYEGSALELLGALRDYVGPDRTLVMPAFNFGEPGRGARDTLRDNPRFDIRRTPSQMGLLTELFRRSRDARQSYHPVYRVAAIGPEAEALVAGHESAPAGMGEATPFDYMAQRNAQILGIGKTFQVMTQVHHVEALSSVDWPAPVTLKEPLPVMIVDKDREVDVSIGGIQQHWKFNIWKLRKLMSPEDLREWRFHNCPLFAARAGEVTERLVEAAGRGFVLYDP